MGADRNKAASLLAALTWPGPVIAAVFILGLDRGRWLGLFGAGTGLVAIVLIVLASAMRPAPGQVQKAEASERFATVLALGFALGASSTEFLLADLSVPLALGLMILAGAWVLIWLPSKMRSIVAETSVEIDRDVATVFAYVSDFRNLVQWFPGYLSVEKVTPGPIAVGTRFHSRVQVGSAALEGDDDIVEFEPGRRLASRTPGSQNLGVDLFGPSGAGTTVTHRFEGIVGYGLAVMGGARNRAATAEAVLSHDRPAFARLKQVLEGAVQSSPPAS